MSNLPRSPPFHQPLLGWAEESDEDDDPRYIVSAGGVSSSQAEEEDPAHSSDSNHPTANVDNKDGLEDHGIVVGNGGDKLCESGEWKCEVVPRFLDALADYLTPPQDCVVKQGRDVSASPSVHPHNDTADDDNEDDESTSTLSASSPEVDMAPHDDLSSEDIEDDGGDKLYVWTDKDGGVHALDHRGGSVEGHISRRAEDLESAFKLTGI